MYAKPIAVASPDDIVFTFNYRYGAIYEYKIFMSMIFSLCDVTLNNMFESTV